MENKTYEYKLIRFTAVMEAQVDSLNELNKLGQAGYKIVDKIKDVCSTYEYTLIMERETPKQKWNYNT